MHVTCPSCLLSVEAGPAAPTEEVVCPSCGSSFRPGGDSTTAWDPAEGPRRFGKFQVIDRVGLGGFGTVYKARDPELDRLVAIKVPRSGAVSGADIDRFLREARSVAQLRHPSIVPLFEVGQQEGVPYLVSEFVHGMTLADLMSGRRPAPGEAARLVADVADALQYAHDRGIVHRDVKPSNILLGEDGKPHLMDFGLAKREAGEATLTVEGQVLGTPAYMSPEQARGEGHKVDGRSDVYSLGVVLYQLLTGQLPFRGTPRMLLHQVLHDDPPPPRKLEPRLPRDLETVCLQALARDPGRRYATAAEMGEDLRRFLRGEPVRARRPGLLERAGRWARRRREVVWASAGAGLTACFGLLLAVLFLRRPGGPPPGPAPRPPEPVPVQAPKESSRSAEIALIPPDTFGFVVVELGALRKAWAGEGRGVREALDGFLGEMERGLGVRAGQMERAVMFLGRAENGGILADPVIVLTASAPQDRDGVLRTVLSDYRQRKTERGAVYYASAASPPAPPRRPPGRAVHFVNERTFVYGPEVEVRRLLTRPASAESPRPWESAWRATGPAPVFVAGLYPPEFLLPVLGDDVLKKRPSLRRLLSCRFATLAVDPEEGGQTRLELTVDFPPQVAGEGTRQAIRDALALVQREVAGALAVLPVVGVAPEMRELIRSFERALGAVQVDLVGTAVRATTRVRKSPTQLLGGVMSYFALSARKVGQTAQWAQAHNNMKQIVMGMHQYLDAHDGRFPPPAIYGKDGKPLLSWRVAILPYLEQGELYKQFKLDEPWDSPHNKKLLEKMPRVYASAGRGPRGDPASEYVTRYQVFVGKGAAFEEGRRRGLAISDFPDGTSNTLLLVEAGKPVPWTKPEDLPYDPDKPLPKLGGVSEDGFNAVTVDGAVHFIRKTIDEKTLRDLITRNGGRDVDWGKVPK